MEQDLQVTKETYITGKEQKRIELATQKPYFNRNQISTNIIWTINKRSKTRFTTSHTQFKSNTKIQTTTHCS